MRTRERPQADFLVGFMQSSQIWCSQGVRDWSQPTWGSGRQGHIGNNILSLHDQRPWIQSANVFWFLPPTKLVIDLMGIYFWGSGCHGDNAFSHILLPGQGSSCSSERRERFGTDAAFLPPFFSIVSLANIHWMHTYLSSIILDIKNFSELDAFCPSRLYTSEIQQKQHYFLVNKATLFSSPLFFGLSRQGLAMLSRLGWM